MPISRVIPVLFLLVSAHAGADTAIPISTSAELVDLLSNSPSGVPDGAVIEMAAGTYAVPADGFLIFNPARDFTIRAATPGTVILNGLGSERIFRVTVFDSGLRGAIVFDGLVFRNGFSTSSSFGSAITLQDSDATFIDCVFEDNVNRATGSGAGTVGLRLGSSAFFVRSIWRDNTSLTSGAAVVVVSGSTFWCHECQFLRNRNNVPDHSVNASGGAFTATNESSVYLSNTRFEANEAAFAGGAFNIKGDFAEASPTSLVAVNSTFVDNFALPDPGTSTSSPSSGGAAHLEDHATARLYNTRWIDNDAQFGGAISSYRGELEVYDSVFRGNFATGRASTGTPPRGGTIFVNSNDNSTDGVNNRPAAALTIRDSLFEGRVTSPRSGSQTTPAHTGGCLYLNGDINRQLGQGGVPQGGTQAQNSAILDVAGSAFVDCDVDELLATGTFGGGVYSALTIVTLEDSLFAGCDTAGGSGGALAFTRFTDAMITDTVFADNSSTDRGGAILALGTEIVIDGGSFLDNEVPGATVEGSRGAALFAGPQAGAGLGIGGVVRNSTFVDNGGLAIYDEDQVDGTGLYNLVTYRNNRFFGNAFSPLVYRNTLMGGVGAGIVDSAGLNAMTVDRGGGNTTDKAPFNDNQALAAQPEAGMLLAVPPQIIDQTAAGDAQNATESFLAYAWHGACAELDGTPLAANFGLTGANTGVHSLMVFDNGSCSGAPDLDLVAAVTQAPTPSASLSADPVMISGGGTSTLSWGTPSGTFLESALDQGQGVLGSASGSVVVSPALTTNYTFFAITEEGGDSAEQRVFVDEDPIEEIIFSDGFESGNTSAWSSTTP